MLAATMAMPIAFAEHMTVVPSDEASKNAFLINKGVKWHNSLETAQSQAKKEGKLVFWMHMLGTVDGAT